MEQFKFIQVTPDELVNIISETTKIQFQELSILLKENLQIKEKKEFLDRKSTAKLFGVSLVCIHDWQKKGILKCYKMARRSYFKYSELLETLYNSKNLAL